MGTLPDKTGSRWNVAVRDPVWKHIWITPELETLSRSKPFSRLYRIKQLGPAEYVYPGATHSRASHSFGVLHLARRMLSVLLETGAESWTTDTGRKSFLAAALLHDLGHFPFTHALKELPLLEHEELTAQIIRMEPLRTHIASFGGDADMTAEIILGGDRGDEESRFFSRILSGVLDPDKLDYLNRDAYFCGVPYGIQDTDFILSHMHCDRNRGIVLDSSAIMSVESVLFSKYLMYRSVYWHRTIRIATAMMKKFLFTALDRSCIAPEELYACDDDGIFALAHTTAIPECILAEMIRNRSFYDIVFSVPYVQGDNPRLETLSGRAEAETGLSELLSGLTGRRMEDFHIVIDIPERISFESDLYIADEGVSFTESSTVFSRSVVSGFLRSLRKIRVAVHPDHAPSVRSVPSLTGKLANYLGLHYTEGSDSPAAGGTDECS